MRTYDQKDWDLFISYVVLLGSTMKIVSPTIDDAMDCGVVRVKDLEAVKKGKCAAEQLIIIGKCFELAIRK
jgi:hypothetical protein